MKTIISISIIILMLAGCESGNVEMKLVKHTLDSGKQIREIVIDGCEYLWGSWGDGSVLVHKGNCKNHH